MNIHPDSCHKDLWDYFICAEEYYNPLKDKYNRVGSFSSFKDCLEPLISQKLVENGFCPTYPNGKTFAICLTHDIDTLFIRKKEVIKQIILSSVGSNRSLLKNITTLLNKNKSHYISSIYKILDIESKYNAKSSFYFLSLLKNDEDFNYYIEDIDFIIDMIIRSGNEIGLHGGHKAYNDKMILSDEKRRFEKILKKEIIGYRNHYLRFEIPTTWEILSGAGFRYDTTFTYHNCISYRNGMCHPFIPYSLKTNDFINILEIPLGITDFALHDYMRLDKSTALNFCKSKIEEIASLKGAVSLLYHNEKLYGFDFYDELLNFCNQNNAWLTSSEELFHWWSENNFCKQYNTKEKLSLLSPEITLNKYRESFTIHAPYKKILFLFTSSFPFSPWESYVENEITFLSTAFDEIYIFSASGTDLAFDLPPNVYAFNTPVKLNMIKKIKSIRYLFSGKFFNELFFIKKELKTSVSLKKIKIFLAEMQKAFIFNNTVLSKIKYKFQKDDIIYFYSFWNDYKAIAACFLKTRFPFAKSISRAHGWEVYLERNTENYLPGKSFMLKNLDAIYYVSENGLNYSSDKFGKHTNLKVSKLGTFNSITPDFRKIRKPFHIVSCSSLIPIKRIELIIYALQLLDQKYNVKWTHIGDSSGSSYLKESAYKSLSANQNLSVHFTGNIINKQVMEFLKNNNVNLFINVSRTEGLPVTIMESMSFGIPVIGTNVGGVSEIIDNEKNGILLTANPSPQEIMYAIEKFILMDDELYSDYCKIAYQKWSEKFNAEKNYPAFIHEIFSL